MTARGRGWARHFGARTAVAVLASATVLGGAAGLPALDGDLDARDVVAAYSEEGLPPGPVRALAVRSNGLLWIATEAGLSRYDGVRFRRFDARHLPEPPCGPPMALAESADGRLWVGGERGLAVWDGANFRAVPPEAGSEPAVTALAVAPDGALWIGTRSAGACRLSGGARECLSGARGLPGGEVRALVFDRGGTLWAATSAGIARFDGTRFTTVSSESATALIAHGDGVLAGGERAVLQLPGGRALVERGPAEPAGVLARALLVDRSGDLWIGGTRLARRRAGALLLDVDRAGRFGRELSALAEDHEGNLWIGTRGGELRRVRAAAAAVAVPRQAPEAVIDALVADGRALALDQAVPPDTERVEIVFTAAAFAEPDALVFRYRMVGYERAWQTASEARRATYTRLPPGELRFEVVTALRGVEARSAPTVLELQVEPHWHQTLAFRLLVVAVGATALALAHRWRLARHRRREAELGAEVAARTAELRRLNENLAQIVEEQTGQIRETRDMAVLTLARLAELRDGTTGEHLDRIAWYSRCLARALAGGPFGPLGEEFVEELFRSSPLHDIGKVAIPDAILCKRGPLDDEERRVMESHTTIGGDTLRRVIERGPTHSFLAMAMEIAYGHHERWDGAGYPLRLAGDRVPLSARIVALVDAYDAITSPRPYKQGLPHEEAVRRILSDAGRHFDPRLVEGFRGVHEELDAIRRAHPRMAES